MQKENNMLAIAKKIHHSRELDTLGWARTKLYKETIFRHLQLILYSVLYEVDFSPSKQNGPKIFYSQNHCRTPHTSAMLRQLRGICQDNIAPALLEIRLSDRLALFQAPKKIIRTFIHAIKYKNESISWLQSITLSACDQKGIHDTKKLTRAIDWSRTDPVLTFCDAIGAENLVAQIAKKAGKRTITLQHGQYRILNEKSFSADAEAYLNFVSDKMLCWGQATITEFAKAGISSDRFISCGRLIPATKYAPCTTAPDNIFGLILCGENQAQSNISLLDFAEKLSQTTGMQYVVKLHPANSIARYEKLKGNGCIKVGKIDNPAYFSACSFSIMAMSGFFLDCIEARHRFVFLDDGGLSDVFKASGLAVTRTDEIIPLVNSISSSTFDSLAEDYNDNKFQKERIIDAIYGTPCNSI